MKAPSQPRPGARRGRRPTRPRPPPAPGAPQEYPPPAPPLLAGDCDGLLEPVLQPRQPVAQGLHVVATKAFDMLGLEPRALERGLDSREVKGRAVREHVAVRELARLGIGMAK